ncbi:hypothetical protein RJT34_32995 [Clitoria ternatea]|uniref:DUF4408 domain-containing protein n=1 Tax=Clitoria ternatea TaxID=43366 RepID=A0AAN9IA13_CLITE
MGDPAGWIASWFTPSSLFILVNLVIATIAITSRFPKNQSSLLQRLSSFNDDSTHSQPSILQRLSSKDKETHTETHHIQPEPENPEKTELVRTPSLLQRLQSRLCRSDSVHQEDSGSGNTMAEMRKSASEKAGSGKKEKGDEEAVEKRRPATMRVETTSFREDEEVDAKADDFIKKFKKQLRLQRMDSIIRYREMLRGGN